MRRAWRRWRCARRGHLLTEMFGPLSIGAPVTRHCSCGFRSETYRGDGVLLLRDGVPTGEPLFPEEPHDSPFNRLARGEHS